jgi:hypothetical protein
MQIKAAISVTTSLFVLLITPCLAHATPKACDLLSSKIAASVAASPVGNPVDTKGVSCAYAVPKKNLFVQITIGDLPGTTAVSTIESYKKTTPPGTTMETIPNLGDQGLLVISSTNLDSLVVAYHQKLISLNIQTKMTPELKAAMVKAMKQMIAQI